MAGLDRHGIHIFLARQGREAGVQRPSSTTSKDLHHLELLQEQHYLDQQQTWASSKVRNILSFGE
jgi:hypothetical protein